MYDILSKKLKTQIRNMELVSGGLMLLILVLSLSFPIFVGAFDYFFNDKPKVINEFNHMVWRFRDEVGSVESNIKSLAGNADLPAGPMAAGIESNIASLGEEAKAVSTNLDELANSVRRQQESIYDNYLNAKRILLLVAGLFVAYLIKLLGNLYRYNAHLHSHYLSVSYALDMAKDSESGEGKIDLERMRAALDVVSSKEIKLSETQHTADSLVQKVVGNPGAKKLNQ